jgi:phosphoserine phosphatase RsbU/P
MTEPPNGGDLRRKLPRSRLIIAALGVLLALALVLSLLLCQAGGGDATAISNGAILLLSVAIAAAAWWLGKRSAEQTAPANETARLTRTNEALQLEITGYKRTEEALRKAHGELQHRIEQRTAELADANRVLQAEISDRQDAEEKFRLVVEGSPNAMVIVNQAGEIVLVNTQTERFFGYQRGDLLGQPVEILVPERFRRQHRSYLNRFLEKPQSRMMGVGRDLLARRKDGGEFPVEIGLSPINTAEETLVLSIIVDITDRKRAEEQLFTLSRVVEQSPNAVMVTDPGGRIEYVNPKFTDVTGYSAREVLGTNPHILQSGETSPEVYQELWRLSSSGKEWRGEIRDRKKNGELYWARQSISSIKDTNGVITHYVSIMEDITAHKQVEEALKESEERFRQMADMAGEWIWEQDPEGCYIYCSAAVKAIVGYEPEEVVGRFFYELFTVEDQRQVAPDHYVADNKEPFFGLINHYRHKDGRTIVTESTGAPILDAKGNLIKWRGVDRDITERLQAEEEIRRAHVKLAVAKNEMKIARQIQESLLPAAPVIMPGLRIHGHCMPADLVGGDYFDYFRQQGDCVDVVIADVSGHSVGPALFMVETRSAIRTHAHLTENPAETLAMMNESLYDDLNQADHFITMFYMRYDSLNHRLSYANAGQCPPLLLRPGQLSCSELDADGLVLGVMKDVHFEEKELDLNAGDMVFLYTDGITEAENPKGELFGTRRLCETLTAHIELDPQQLIDELIEQLQSFRQKKTFDDDVTIVILKVDH